MWAWETPVLSGRGDRAISFTWTLVFWRDLCVEISMGAREAPAGLMVSTGPVWAARLALLDFLIEPA